MRTVLGIMLAGGLAVAGCAHDKGSKTNSNAAQPGMSEGNNNSNSMGNGAATPETSSNPNGGNGAEPNPPPPQQ